MSLPSLPVLLAEAGVSDTRALPEDKLEELIFAAMQADLPLACDFLHKQSHGDGSISAQDPNSELGKQIIRVCAGDALRSLAEQHLCHGKRITFYNCCSTQIKEERPPRRDMLIGQIECQAGPVAYADC